MAWYIGFDSDQSRAAELNESAAGVLLLQNVWNDRLEIWFRLSSSQVQDQL